MKIINKNSKCKISVYVLFSIIIGIILISYFASYQQSIGLNKAQNNNYYNETLSFQIRQSELIPSGFIHFIGDSHIQSLTNQIINLKSINLGIGSDTTDGVLSRIKLYKSLKTANSIILGIGFNDLKTKDVNYVVNNINKIILNLPKISKIFILELYPINNNSKIYSIELSNKIKSFNKKLSVICDARIYLTCIKTHHLFTQKNKQTLDIKYDIGDGIHLNSKARAKLITKIKTVLKMFKKI